MGRIILFMVVGCLFVVSPALAAQQKQESRPQDRPPEVQLERLLIERGGLLLRPGQVEVEPGLDYAHFSTRRIDVSGFSILPTLIIGAIETEKVQRDLLDPSITVRAGVFKDVQVDVRVPYRFIWDRVSGTTTETKTNDDALGDVEAGISYQPIKEQGWIPDVILGVRFKSRTGQDPFGLGPQDLPTGTGLYSITGTITAVKSSDPAVIFGALIFTHNFDRDVRVALGDAFETEIDPGNTIGYNVGIALAISIDLAFNMRLEQRFTSKTETRVKAPGTRKMSVPGSTLNVAQAVFGITWAISRNVSADVSVGFGLTEDAPDVTVRVAFPVRFTVFE